MRRTFLADYELSSGSSRLPCPWRSEMNERCLPVNGCRICHRLLLALARESCTDMLDNLPLTLPQPSTAGPRPQTQQTPLSAHPDLSPTCAPRESVRCPKC